MAQLKQLGLLSPRFSVAHAIWVSDADIDFLAAAGVTAIHNPLSNLRLGSGIAPLRRMLERGLQLGLGTDGADTSDTQNLFEAMRLAADLVLLDLSQPVYVPLRDATRQLVCGENGSAVDRVLVGDRLVVQAGRVLTVDEVALRRQPETAAERLDALNRSGRHLSRMLRPWVSAFCCGFSPAPAHVHGQPPTPPTPPMAPGG